MKDQVTAKKLKKSRDRLNAHEWNIRFLKLASAFPSSVAVNSKLALERLPEFNYAQNAYGFLKTAAKRKLAEDLGEGKFQLLPSAIERVQKLVEVASVLTKPDAGIGRLIANGRASHFGTCGIPQCTLHYLRLLSFRSGQIQTKSSRSSSPVAGRVGTDHGIENGTILTLSYSSLSDIGRTKSSKLTHLIVPWPECRAAIYGTADIGRANRLFVWWSRPMSAR